MEWSKVKNIILLILLLVNLFFLVQTAQQEHATARYLEEGRSAAVEVLRRGGYEVAEGVLPAERDLVGRAAERDKEAESALATRLLGTVAKTEDGARTLYRGEKGEGWFRGDGSFHISFQEGAYPADQEKAAALLKAAGYPCEVVDRTDQNITVRQIWEGAPLFSCTARLTYEGVYLRKIEGRRLIGAPAPEKTAGKAMDSATALIRFMGGMREGGHVFTKIEGLTLGYQTATTGRRMRLTPMWHVHTDAGNFLMDAVTGEVSPE